LVTHFFVLAGSTLNDDVSLAAAGYTEQQFLFLVVSKPPAAAAHDNDADDSPGLDESFIERQRLLMIADMEAQRPYQQHPGLDESFIERQRLLMIADMEAQRPSQQQRLLVSRRMGWASKSPGLPDPNTGARIISMNPADVVMALMAREQEFEQAVHDSQAAAAARIVGKPGVIEAAASGNLELVTDHFLADANCVHTTNGQYGLLSRALAAPAIVSHFSQPVILQISIINNCADNVVPFWTP
jgi:hypothetical protein